ncbi:hypothetical protein ABT364_22940 [Massilia sp. SR12]
MIGFDMKTVYVLGAGASYEFDLPVGDKLKEQISSLFSYSRGISSGDQLCHEAFNMGTHIDGKDELRHVEFVNAAKVICGGLPLALSIDNFIHNHRDDKYIERCGKIGIVRSILAAEEKSNLYVRQQNGSLDFTKCYATWAVKFVQLLTEQCPLENLPQRLSEITFIVFNYDRCLEHFLLHALAASYNIDRDAAAKIVNNIKIYHPYGVVGNLHWMTGDHERHIGFGETPTAAQLYQLSKGIKTFTEGTDPYSSEIVAIQGSLREASRVVFLGFAYHPLNMKLILGEPQQRSRTCKVFGTALHMSESDTELVADVLADQNHLFGHSAVLRKDAECVKLFREYSRSLGFNN